MEMRFLPSIVLALAAAAAPAQGGGADGGVVLHGAGTTATVAPGLGGRLLAFGPAAGGNALWTAAPGAERTDGWLNWGGEKTWVGDKSLWRGFDPAGRAWPPPAWFDQDGFDVVGAAGAAAAAGGPTGLTLRRGPHGSGGWRVGVERAFRFEADALAIREALLCDAHDAPATNDPRRVWSVAQVPFSRFLAARLRGEGRMRPEAGFPAASERRGDWAVFDLAAAPRGAALALDADALAVDGPAGRLVVEQRAEPRFVEGFAEPGRALVYTTGADSADPAAAYTELEFVALGPDAAHEIVLRLLPPGAAPWDGP